MGTEAYTCKKFLLDYYKLLRKQEKNAMHLNNERESASFFTIYTLFRICTFAFR